MTNPLVHCAGCARAWNSPTMADGLRLVGSCPRCGGTLVFAEEAPAPVPAGVLAESVAVEQAAVAPHLVLGVPRREN